MSQRHKTNCKANAGLREEWKKCLGSIGNASDCHNSSEDISLYELGKRLEKWGKAHADCFRFAAVEALYKPEDSDHIHTHALHITVSPRKDHGNSKFKYFLIVKLETISIKESREKFNRMAGKDVSAGSEAFDSFQHQKEGRYRAMGVMTVPLIFICPPLLPLIRPFEISANLLSPSMVWPLPDWQGLVINVVKEGEPFYTGTIMEKILGVKLT